MNSTFRQAAVLVVIFLVVAWGLSGSAIATEHLASGSEASQNPISASGTSPTVADKEEVDLSQDELVVESGEKVVIENVDLTTPTNFNVKEGGTLIIRNSTLFRTGEHHNDNEDFIAGKLIIENSTIYGENGIPIEVFTGNDAEIYITKSNLKKFNSQYPGVTFFLFSGKELQIKNSSVGTVEPLVSPEVDTIVTITNAKVDRIGLGIKGFSDTVTVENLSRDITKMHFEKSGTVFELTNVTAWKIPTFSSRGSGEKGQIQDVRLINSKARVTIIPPTNFTAINSTTVNPSLKIFGRVHDTYHFSGLTKYGSFRDKKFIDDSYVKIRLVNSTIPEWYNLENVNMRYGAFYINSPGGGKNSEDPDFVIEDSSLSSMKIGHDLSAQNVTANRLSLYNNYGGVIEFDKTSFTQQGESLRIVQGAKVTIKGNVSFAGGVEEFGDLSYLNVKREYPLSLSDVTPEDAEGDQIKVILQNPSSEEVMSESYEPGTEYVFPEATFDLSNYYKEYTLIIQQGNFSTTLPLMLSTDTPIKSASGTETEKRSSSTPPNGGDGELKYLATIGETHLPKGGFAVLFRVENGELKKMLAHSKYKPPGDYSSIRLYTKNLIRIEGSVNSDDSMRVIRYQDDGNEKFDSLEAEVQYPSETTKTPTRESEKNTTDSADASTTPDSGSTSPNKSAKTQHLTTNSGQDVNISRTTTPGFRPLLAILGIFLGVFLGHRFNSP